MTTNTKTILNIKTEKSVKEEAQKVAKELGIPLGMAINSFLKIFIREKEITLSVRGNTPTPYLQRVIKEAEDEYLRGESSGPFSERNFIKHLKNL